MSSDKPQNAGATNIKVETVWNDHAGTLPAGPSQEIFLDTELLMTAYGDPKVSAIA